jgi:hypothetical protein
LQALCPDMSAAAVVSSPQLTLCGATPGCRLQDPSGHGLSSAALAQLQPAPEQADPRNPQGGSGTGWASQRDGYALSRGCASAVNRGECSRCRANAARSPARESFTSSRHLRPTARALRWRRASDPRTRASSRRRSAQFAVLQRVQTAAPGHAGRARSGMQEFCPVKMFRRGHFGLKTRST